MSSQINNPKIAIISMELILNFLFFICSNFSSTFNLSISIILNIPLLSYHNRKYDNLVISVFPFSLVLSFQTFLLADLNAKVLRNEKINYFTINFNNIFTTFYKSKMVISIFKKWKDRDFFCLCTGNKWEAEWSDFKPLRI